MTNRTHVCFAFLFGLAFSLVTLLLSLSIIQIIKLQLTSYVIFMHVCSQAAVLHDTVEDTNTTLEEIEEQFGEEVRSLVDEVSDDKSLPKQERKRLQVKEESLILSHLSVLVLVDCQRSSQES